VKYVPYKQSISSSIDKYSNFIKYTCHTMYILVCSELTVTEIFNLLIDFEKFG